MTRITLITLIALSFTAAGHTSESVLDDPASVTWQRLSSTTGDLPTPNRGDEQTCCVVLDIDRDGIQDFVVGERTQSPSVVWFKLEDRKWRRFVIEDARLNPEAGGVSADIDGDGDPDLILGQDYSGSGIWWWENPCPDFSKPWARRTIKEGGARKHHDQTVGDFDGDGKPELASWNQEASSLLLFDFPDEPRRTSAPWPSRTIFRWEGKTECEGFPTTLPDIDLDGHVDLVGGGRWFKRLADGSFQAEIVDDSMRFTQCAVGQLVEGGRPEIVFSPGDADGMVKWYEWRAGQWRPHDLREVIHGHTCEVGDVDGDGKLDIAIGEMGSPGAGDRARTFVFFGNGKGQFRETIASAGQGIHEGKLADLDGDGDLDILLKPYHHHAPRIDVLLNQPRRRDAASLKR